MSTREITKAYCFAYLMFNMSSKDLIKWWEYLSLQAFLLYPLILGPPRFVFPCGSNLYEKEPSAEPEQNASETVLSTRTNETWQAYFENNTDEINSESKILVPLQSFLDFHSNICHVTV